MDKARKEILSKSGMHSHIFSHLILLFVFSCGFVFGSEPEIKISTSSVSCAGAKDGQVEISWLSDQPDSFSISVLESSSKLIRKYNETSVYPLRIKNLEAGNYKVLFESASNTQNLTFIVESPDKLTASGIYIHKLHINSADTLADLKAEYYGGTPPYSYKWSEETTAQSGDIALKVPFGIYEFYINDDNNCGPASATFFFDNEELAKFNKQK